ncbi:GNAT family N-acetyltransferase [Paucisalibacillus globulus]|uniref:GNAT family N-acetyltransferase n=1 Tax=Paucisalibacillus globulus TaxID=351095 RepID=UPI000405895F|nr:GNAT family N-acetyltransferase [Paucisalibacillus globulus]
MIRLLEPTDAKKYLELRLEALKENPEAFAASYDELISKVNPLEQFEKSIAQATHYNFGAFKDEKLIGMVTLLPETKVNLKHKANIFAMYVTPDERGNGLGKALLDAAIKQARAIDGISRVNLSVVSINHDAKGLYQKFGFKSYGLEEKALKVKNVYFDEEYMSLSLNDE